MSDRGYVESAEVALDDALRHAGLSIEQQLARAQVLATLAGAEQARIANLIAWKQLQATRAAGRDGGVDLLPLGGNDEITDEIERGLGIAGGGYTVGLGTDAPNGVEPEGGDL